MPPRVRLSATKGRSLGGIFFEANLDFPFSQGDFLLTLKHTMTEAELQKILEYYNKYATLKEREFINKALVKRNSKPLKRYLAKYKREMLKIQSDTDRRLYKIRECINTSLTENKTLKFRDSLSK